MDDWQGRINTLREQALAELTEVREQDALEQWRVTYLGRRGALTDVLRGLAALPADQRPAAGQAGNEAKTRPGGGARAPPERGAHPGARQGARGGARST